MERKSAVALHILGVAGALGVVGDLLLRVDVWGLNAPVAAILFAAAFYGLIRHARLPLRASALWLWAEAPLMAGVLAWRDSGPLVALAILGVLVALVSAALAAHGRALRRAGVWDVAAGAVATAFYTGVGGFLLPGAVQWGELRRPGWNRTGVAVARGVLLALPPLVVFGALFVAADAAFARIAGDVIRFDVGRVASHVVLIAVFAWLAAGYLRWVVLDDGSQVPQSDAIGLRLGAVEVGVVVGAVALLFAAFIAVQFTELFGGEAVVRAKTGLTYAEYARTGFFQLVAAAGLVLPLLLVSHWLVRDAAPRGRRTVTGLSAALVVLVFVILGSALFRMRLYEHAYGLTLQRLYTTWFMGWLAVVFVWFAATTLRGFPRRFAAGAVAAGLAGVLVLVAINPEGWIVRANAERARAGAEFDVGYIRHELGADAVPALLAAMPALPQADRCTAAAWLLDHWGTNAAHSRVTTGWRSWSYGRMRATQAVREREAGLRAVACPGGKTKG